MQGICIEIIGDRVEGRMVIGPDGPVLNDSWMHVQLVASDQKSVTIKNTRSGEIERINADGNPILLDDLVILAYRFPSPSLSQSGWVWIARLFYFRNVTLPRRRQGR